MSAVVKIFVYFEHTVKIRDDALGLSGFVSFFRRAYLLGGLSMENLKACFMSLSGFVSFFRGRICGGACRWGIYHGFLR